MVLSCSCAWPTCLFTWFVYFSYISNFVSIRCLLFLKDVLSCCSLCEYCILSRLYRDGFGLCNSCVSRLYRDLYVFVRSGSPPWESSRHGGDSVRGDCRDLILRCSRRWACVDWCLFEVPPDVWMFRNRAQN